MKLRLALSSMLSGLLAISGLAPMSATAEELPAAPVFNQVQLKVLVDNDFAVFMGNDQQITRLFYQNDVGWQQQIQNIQELDVFPNAGETFIYLLPLGGNPYEEPEETSNGEENFSGILNNIVLLDYPGAEVAVGRSSADARDIFHSGYLLLNNYLTDFSISTSDVRDGLYSVNVNDLSDATTGLLWGPAERANHPSIAAPDMDCTVACDGTQFTPDIADGAWDFPDGSAVLFRYPLSNANLPVSPGDRTVTVTWKDPQAGGQVDEYLIEYKETDQPDSAFKVFETVSGTARSSTVTGLTNGTAYTLRVSAVNESGSASSLGRSVVPLGTPSNPQNLSFTAGDGEVTIDFSAPENDGGLAITNYEYSTDNGQSWNTQSPASTATSIVISGLTNFSEYDVRVRAVNPYGAGPASLPLKVEPGIVSTRTLTYSSGTLASVQSLPQGGVYNQGDSFEVAAGPIRENFTFMGWKEGEVTYSPGETFTIGSSNPTLTAQWIQDSLLGLAPENRSRVLTWNIVQDQSIDVTVAAGADNSVRVQIPANALDPGTEVIFWRLLNDSLAKQVINSDKDYFVNLAITWSLGDDVNTPKRVFDATVPVAMTIENPSILAGATAWQILGGEAKVVGKAVEDGVLSLSFSQDPVITGANVPPVPQFDLAVSTSDGFSVNVTNYDPSYTWSAPTVTSGSVEVVSTAGTVRSLLVGGLSPGESATVTQTTSINGVSESASVEGFAIDNRTSPSTSFSRPVITGFGEENLPNLYEVSPGQKALVNGKRLSSVTGAKVMGIEAEIESISDEALVISIPIDAAFGEAELTLSSPYGNVSFPFAFNLVNGSDLNANYGELSAWTRRISETEAKVYVKYPTLGEKAVISVQRGGAGDYETIFSRTIESPSDEALRLNEYGSYIVRTVELGTTTRFRVFVGGEKHVQVRYNSPSL